MENEIRWLLQEKYDGELTAAAKKDIKRLKAGEPLDYVIGFVEFLGCKIDLSKKPLIPRFETEFWVEEVFGQMSNVKGQMSCLDMFSGSGAIGISIMRHIKNAHVTFVDSEQNCIEQIKINLKINKLSKKRYKVSQSNLFENLKSEIINHKSFRFDYIFANPPYISNNQDTRLPARQARNKIQKSVLLHEPRQALFGGNGGLLY